MDVKPVHEDSGRERGLGGTLPVTGVCGLGPSAACRGCNA